MGPDLADTVISPFVHVQLTQPRGGVAIGGLLAAWWLSSHLFEATGHALDSAYGVTDRRPTISAACSPSGSRSDRCCWSPSRSRPWSSGRSGTRRTGVASDLGMGDVYRTGWAVLRWPILLVIVVGFLVSLYRFSPNVRHCWRDCLPGAVFGAALWIAAAIAFRVSAAIGLQSSRGVSGGDANVDIIGQSVNAVIATVLWAYLASIAILFGGELNAVLRRARAGRGARGAGGHARRAGRPARFESAPREHEPA